MKNFLKYQWQSFVLFWREGFSSEIYRVSLVAVAILFFGFCFSLLQPALGERAIRFFSASLAESSILEQSGFALFWSILTNNISALLSTLVWSAIPFLYLAAFSLGINFFLIGAFGAYYMRSGYSLLAYLSGILPHGIFELPALLLACAAGLCLCRSITNRIRKKDSLSIVDTLNGCVGLYWLILFPLTILAALVETFITPQILNLFL